MFKVRNVRDYIPQRQSGEACPTDELQHVPSSSVMVGIYSGVIAAGVSYEPFHVEFACSNPSL